MARGVELPAGPILATDARAIFRDRLKHDVLEDEAIQVWAGLQWQALRGREIRLDFEQPDGRVREITTKPYAVRGPGELLGGLDSRGLPWIADGPVWIKLTRREAKTRRHGAANPALARVTPGARVPETYVEPKLERKRPRGETRDDEATALLLRAHPWLADKPLLYEVLRALFGLDAGDMVRLPGPYSWTTDRMLAQEQRDAIRKRGQKRLERARALNVKGEGAAKAGARRGRAA